LRANGGPPGSAGNNTGNLPGNVTGIITDFLKKVNRENQAFYWKRSQVYPHVNILKKVRGEEFLVGSASNSYYGAFLEKVNPEKRFCGSVFRKKRGFAFWEREKRVHPEAQRAQRRGGGDWEEKEIATQIAARRRGRFIFLGLCVFATLRRCVKNPGEREVRGTAGGFFQRLTEGQL